MNSQVPKPSKPDANQPAKADASTDSSGSDTGGEEISSEVASAQPARQQQDAGGRGDRPKQRFRAIEGRGGGGAAGTGQAAAQKRRPQRQGEAGSQPGLVREANAPDQAPSAPRPAGPESFAPSRKPDSVPDPKPAPQAPSPQAVSASEAVRAAAPPARMKTRHYGVFLLALLLIVVPGIVSGVYLWKYAVDQYVSEAGFAIRTESTPSPFDFLGALVGGSTTTGKDMDILNSFVTSQQLVAKLDKELDLRKMFSKPANDPYFAFHSKGATIEDLVNYWKKMVVVNYDNTTGLMQLDVYAFTPQDAQKIAAAVLRESSALVNKLANVAQNDTTRYAKEAVDQAKKNLTDSTSALTTFRIKNNIVDPRQDLLSQQTVVQTLTQQLVEAQIQLATLQQGAAAASDPRVSALQQRIDVIQTRIGQENQKVAVANGSGSQGYAEIVAQYEKLQAEQDFNQKTYLAALATYEADVATAQQKKVYLATYEQPTLAQSSTAPQRWLLLATVMLIGFFIWAIITMIYYALRDRR